MVRKFGSGRDPVTFHVGQTEPSARGAIEDAYFSSTQQHTTSKKMTHSPTRRTLLLALASAPFIAACTSPAARGISSAQDRLAVLETSSGGRLGVAALSTVDHMQLNYRANERFA